MRQAKYFGNFLFFTGTFAGLRCLISNNKTTQHKNYFTKFLFFTGTFSPLRGLIYRNKQGVPRTPVALRREG